VSDRGSPPGPIKDGTRSGRKAGCSRKHSCRIETYRPRFGEKHSHLDRGQATLFSKPGWPPVTVPGRTECGSAAADRYQTRVKSSAVAS
jgi:hypothetical protein